MSTQTIYFFWLLIFFSVPLFPLNIFLNHQTATTEQTTLSIQFELTPNEVLLKDSLRFSVDVPEYYILRIDKPESSELYFSSIKGNKRVYTQSFTVLLALINSNQKRNTKPFNCYCSYLIYKGQTTSPNITQIPCNKKNAALCTKAAISSK